MLKTSKFSAVVVAMFAGGLAQAQSSTTVYGLLDVSIRYTTHADATGNSLKALGDGALNGNRLGIRGTEGIGDGMKAIFTLEHGPAVNTGTIEQQGQFFGRQAWVGLSGSIGSVTFGRQYGMAFRGSSAFDPLGNGNFANENAPQILLTGVRFDNSIVYVGTFANTQIGLMLALGEQANGFSIGKTVGLTLSQELGPINLNAGYQSSIDVHSKEAKTFLLGATYGNSGGKLYLGYIDSRRDAGFAAGANLSGTPLANTSLMPAFNALTVSGIKGTVAASRQDKMLIVGANRAVASSLNVIVGFLHDSISGAPQAPVSQGITGARTTSYGVLQYLMSKRTDLYLEVDYNKFKDANAGNGIANTGLNYNGFATRSGLAIGMRHSF